MAIRLGDVFVALRADSSGLDSDLQQARGQVTGWANNLAGNATKLIGGAVVGAAAAATTAVVGIGAAAFNTASQFDAATKRIQSQLNLSDQQAKEFGQTIQDVYANNFGDSINDVAESVSEVERAFSKLGGTTGPQQLQQATEDAIALRDAFGVGVNESVEAAAELMDKFGLSSDEAFGFLASGYQRGLNSSDDFLDSITEYSTQFANGGADATQFFSLLESGLQAGSLGTDKAADAFKEFRLRIQDGSKLTNQGLELLGLNAEQITKGLADGTLSVADAFEIVTEAIRNTEDPTLRMQAGVALIGTQFEDLGDTAVNNLRLTKFGIDELTESTDALNKQYETLPTFFEGLRRRALVAIAPIGDAMLSVANSLLPTIETVFKQIETGIATFLANSNFEWSPDFKQIKLGDLFEFVQEGGVSTIDIADYVKITWSDEFKQIKLGSFFEFLQTETATTFNLADYVTFVYDNTTGALALTIGDVFSFTANENGFVIDLADYVVFSWTGQGVTLTIGDVFTLDTTNGTEINLADFLVIEYSPDGEPVKIKVGNLYELDNTGDKKTVNVADVIQVETDISGSVTQIDLTSLFAFALPIGWNEILALGALPEIVKLTFGDFFDFGGKTQVTTGDVIDLSETPQTPPKLTLNSFLDFVTGGDGNVVKITTGDLFDFTADNREKIVKLQVGDFIAFNDGETAKISWGDLFTFERDADFNVTKLKLGDFLDFADGEGVKVKFGDVFDFSTTDGITKLTLGDFLEFVEGEGTKVSVMDFFDLTIDAEGVVKFTLGDFFDFAEGYNIANWFTFSPAFSAVGITSLFSFLSEDGKYDLGKAFSFDVSSFTAITLADLFPFLGEDSTKNLGSLFTLDAATVGTITLADLFPFLTGETFDLTSIFTLGELPTFGLSDIFSLGEGQTTLSGPDWATLLPPFKWDDYGVKLDWGKYIKDVPWATWVSNLLWGDYIDDVAWADWLNKLVWTDWIDKLTWDTFLDVLDWTTIIDDFPSWSSIINDIPWPSIPAFPGWGALLNNLNPFATSGSGDAGGGTVQPASVNVNSGDVLAAGVVGAASVPTPQPIVVNVGPNYVTNDTDVEQLAYRVAQRLAYGI